MAPKTTRSLLLCFVLSLPAAIIFNAPPVTCMPDAGAPANILDKAKEGLHHASEAINDRIDDAKDMAQEIMGHSTLAGQIGPLIEKLHLSPHERERIIGGIRQVANVIDIVVLIGIGWFLVPAIAVPYEKLSPPTRGFEGSKTYHLSTSLAQVAKLALAVYAVDLLKIAFVGAGFKIPRDDRITHAFAYIVFTAWIANRIALLKRGVISRITGESAGRLDPVNRLIDALLYVIAGFIILDILNVEMGLAFKGVAAFGSVGTIVFSLGAQNIAKQLLYGIMLSASDRIYVGDSILLGKSGFSGTVSKLGWTETVIRGSDEVMVTLPNSDLIAQQLSNLSRIHQCQVKETVLFGYGDSEKLAQLAQDVKTEIKKACPAVITDGSRPFRVHWTGFDHAGYLKFVVDTYYRIKPVGDDFHDNRQRVLQAIDTAIRMNKLSPVEIH